MYSFLIYCFKAYNNLKSRNIGKHSAKEVNPIELFSEKPGKESVDFILKYAAENSPKSLTVLKCYYLMYKTVSSVDNVKNFFEFKAALDKYGNEISKSDLKDLFACIGGSLQRIKSHEIDVDHEFRDYYKSLIAKNIFLEPNGKLREYRFNNYIHYSCRPENTDETIQFIDEYINKLPKASRANSYNFGMAYVNFTKSEFGKALEYISKINENYFDMKLRIKTLQLMIYFELKDYESFEYSLDSNRHFTNNNKSVNESDKESNNMFLNFVNRLFKLKDKYDEYEFKKLENEIKDSFIPQRKWLLKKSEEMRKGTKKNV